MLSEGLLLDSHVVLWSTDKAHMLGPETMRLMSSTQSYVSAITHVEFAVKRMLGKLSVPSGFDEGLTGRGMRSLPLTDRHARAMYDFSELVGHDPFDRMLLAQAHAERMTFVTADRRLLALGLDWVVDARA